MSRGGFNSCFEFTVDQEGKYSDDPKDRGNWTGGAIGRGILAGTAWGISAPTMVAWVGPRNAFIVTAEYMKAVTLATAKMIYKIMYWDKLQCDQLATGIDLTVWDFGVNTGVSESAKCLQQVVHTQPDGLIGPATLAAAGTWNSEVLLHALIGAHDRYYRSLNDPRCLKGWLDRQDRLQTAALNLISVTKEVT